MTEPGRRVAAIGIAVVDLVLAVLSLFFAAMSVMMFDAPGSETDRGLWIVFWSTWAVPLALLAGGGFAVAAAIRYSRRRLMLSLALPAAAIGWLIIAFATLA